MSLKTCPTNPYYPFGVPPMSVRIVRLACRRLNAFTGPELHALVDAACDAGATLIGVDLSEVTDVDSHGLSALVGAYRRCPTHARVVLIGVHEHVKNVLKLTRLANLFDVYDDAAAVTDAHH